MYKYLALFGILILSACVTSGTNTSTYEGYDVSGPINGYDVAALQARQIEVINAIRQENGAAPVQPSAQLTASALNHARDIARLQRAWNYGSDKSSPQSRGERAGFFGIVTGENVAETYRGEIDVMRSWLRDPLARAVILDPDATHVGVSWFMETSGKVWWVQDFGQSGASQQN